MKTAILIVVASVHFTGSYFNQSELSSVLSQWEGTLVFPRKTQVDKIGSGSTTSPGTAAPTPSPVTGSGSTTSPGTAAPTPLPVTGSVSTTSPRTAASTPLPVSRSTPATPTEEDEHREEIKETEEDEHMETEVEQTEVEQTEVEQTEVEQTEVEQTEVEQTEVEQTEVEQTEVEDGVNGTEFEATVVDKESIITTTASPAATSTSSIISTTASPAATSTRSTSPRSTSTMTSTMTMTSALTTSKAKQTRMLQVKSGAGWSSKDTVLGLHLGMGLWLLIVTGGATYFGGAITLLWVRLEALRARSPPPPPPVDV